MDHSERTRELLITHYKTYPKMQIQDLFKFLFQSSFGCEHMISSLENITNYISREYETISHDCPPVAEALNGEYYRVHLSCLNDGLSVNTLGHLFFLSAKREENGKAALMEKLCIAKELIREGLLPFSLSEFEKTSTEWENAGYPAIHHSEVFREAYQPAYRVIAKEFIPFLPLFTELDRRLETSSKTDIIKVAIEGGSAGGKSTLGKLLTDIYGCTLFHIDDFFLQPYQRTPERFAQAGGNFDRERFLTEVLLPLEKGETICYRKFDCSTMSLEDPVYISPKKLSVIEGAYSMHPELAPHYDFSVLLDIAPEVQRERILHRNSPEMAKRFFEQWIPLENTYFSTFHIKERCDMRITI